MFSNTIMNYSLNHINLKDPVTTLMENIIELHHFIMFHIFLISGLTLWLLIIILDNFINLIKFKDDSSMSVLKDYMSKVARNFPYRRADRVDREGYKFFQLRNITLDSFLKFIIAGNFEQKRVFKDNNYLETVWTLGPCIILMLISLPSFYMLYISEEQINTILVIKAIGYQWYWNYDYSGLFTYYYNIHSEVSLKDNIDIDSYIIESYMEQEEYLDLSKGQLRLLETDNILLIPIGIHVRLIVTSADTLHSFALPSLGVKIDAIPGRLNKMDLYINQMGVFYGQCSEICGVGHGFMPICAYTIPFLNFLVGTLK